MIRNALALTLVALMSSTAAVACSGDADGSETVDFDDLLIVLSNWGGDGSVGDVTDDGAVDFDDLLLVIANWGDCEDVVELVALANAYVDSLSSSQQAVTVVDFTAANAAKWSNLPSVPSGSLGTNSMRNGVAYSTLTSVQREAWDEFVNAALGATGAGQLDEIRASDDYLGDAQNGYSGDYVYLAFVGAPSETGDWMMQVGGHHVAFNVFFTGNDVQATSPYFLGVEPQSFTLDGTAYAPMEDQRAAMYDLVNSLTSAQLAQAHLSSSFSDVYLGPGDNDPGLFPTGTSGRGILGSALTSAQQELIATAISTWVQDSPDAATYQALYESELDETYVAYSGQTSLTNQGDYVRIDGPHVWIELVCQNGVVFSGIHFHSIWRDRVSDYNAAFGF